MLDKVYALLAEVLPADTADQVLSWLLGTIVQQQMRPQPLASLRAELERMLPTQQAGPTGPARV
jgi:hypothetical protein